MQNIPISETIPTVEKVHNYDPYSYYYPQTYESSYKPLDYLIPEPIIHGTTYSALPYSQPQYVVPQPYYPTEYIPLHSYNQPEYIQHYPLYSAPIEEPKSSIVHNIPHHSLYYDPYPTFMEIPEYPPAKVEPVNLAPTSNFTAVSYTNPFTEPATDFDLSHIKVSDSIKRDPILSKYLKNIYSPPKSAYLSPQNKQISNLSFVSPVINLKSSLIGSNKKKTPITSYPDLELINSTSNYIDKLLNSIGISPLVTIIRSKI